MTKVKTKTTFKYGGVELDILNQTTPYVPTFTSPISLTKDFEKALAIAINSNLPTLLMGETGTGKTSAVREIAYMRKQGYTRINMTGYVTPDELIGSKSVKNGATYYEDGILTKAMKEGHIVVLDEINATPPDCLFILHGLMDDDHRVALPNGDLVFPHADFRVFATMNPDYEGTRGLNRAFLDRFSIILNFDLPTPKKEQEILISKSGVAADIAEKMVTLAHAARKSYAEQKTLTFVSIRSLLQWAKLFVNGGMQIKEAYITSIANKARTEERTAFVDMYSAVFKDKPEEEADALVLTSRRQLDGYEQQVRTLQDRCQILEKTAKEKESENSTLKVELKTKDEMAKKMERETLKLSETVTKIQKAIGFKLEPIEAASEATTAGSEPQKKEDSPF
jgi:nitric oxide reductase NorQ protein